MQDTVLNFYDQLSASYHLIGQNWPETINRQGRILDSIIKKYLKKNSEDINLYDCSCGIGTQAIGLALNGYNVHATDLSPKAILKAELNAKEAGAKLTLGVADFRFLEKTINTNYDVIISFDNSLPHLLTQADLQLATNSIFQALKPGGLFIASIRDYDQLKKDRPSGVLPRKIQDKEGIRVYFQTWDWSADGSSYELELFVVQNNESSWKAPMSFKTHYRAVQRSDLNDALCNAGFEIVDWLLGDENPYYQPVVIAKRLN